MASPLEQLLGSGELDALIQKMNQQALLRNPVEEGYPDYTSPAYDYINRMFDKGRRLPGFIDPNDRMVLQPKGTVTARRGKSDVPMPPQYTPIARIKDK